ncbi:hypothetical protein ACSQ67_017319 [Phaseolus vulgaris]
MFQKAPGLIFRGRKQILLKIVDALEANEKIIRIENEADVTTAQEAGYEKSLVARLALKPGKVRKYTQKDYQDMPEWKLDGLLKEYGLPTHGDLAYKRQFAIGAFLWPNSSFTLSA